LVSFTIDYSGAEARIMVRHCSNVHIGTKNTKYLWVDFMHENGHVIALGVDTMARAAAFWARACEFKYLVASSG
jgi:hypothetical protein